MEQVMSKQSQAETGRRGPGKWVWAAILAVVAVAGYAGVIIRIGWID